LIAIVAVATVLNALAAAIVFGGAALLLGGLDGRIATGISFAVFSFPMTVVSTYCNVALLRMAQARFEGRHCSAREGFAAANRRLPAIIGWSVLATGVGALLEQISERIPFGGRLLSWALGVAWSLATMFALPVLALEDAGARTAARRSVQIFRARWGEGLIGEFTISFLTGLIAIPGVLLVLGGLATAGALGVALVVAGGAIIAVSATLTRGLDQLFALAVYRDQVLGETTFGLAAGQIDQLVKTKRRHTR
jgi:Family of unknown function (DUF6159)